MLHRAAGSLPPFLAYSLSASASPSRSPLPAPVLRRVRQLRRLLAHPVEPQVPRRDKDTAQRVLAPLRHSHPRVRPEARQREGARHPAEVLVGGRGVQQPLQGHARVERRLRARRALRRRGTKQSGSGTAAMPYATSRDHLVASGWGAHQRGPHPSAVRPGGPARRARDGGVSDLLQRRGALGVLGPVLRGGGGGAEGPSSARGRSAQAECSRGSRAARAWLLGGRGAPRNARRSA